MERTLFSTGCRTSNSGTGSAPVLKGKRATPPSPGRCSSTGWARCVAVSRTIPPGKWPHLSAAIVRSGTPPSTPGQGDQAIKNRHCRITVPLMPDYYCEELLFVDETLRYNVPLGWEHQYPDRRLCVRRQSKKG